jgi:uncharacterized protein YdcH (DUF465 family)
LKLHIEVLQEKIDDLEKDASKHSNQLQDEMQKAEARLRDEFSKSLDQKQSEIDRLT